MSNLNTQGIWLASWRSDYQMIRDSGIFDSDWYLDRYPDVAKSGLHALEHYVKYGCHLGRPPNGVVKLDFFWTLDLVKDLVRANTDDALASKVKVTIICITFNQEKYVAQMIESLISQKTDFEFEILIGDDNSSDDTARIIAAYAENDKRIIPYLRTVNLGPNKNFENLARNVRGEYVAICEGDDYWIDENKLQLQLQYLEQRPEYSICFHPVRVVQEDIPGIETLYPEECREEIFFHDLLRHNYIQTNSVMYRWRYNAQHKFYLPKNLAPGDWYTHLLHAQVGRVGFIDRVMAVYRKHSGGMWASHKNEIERHKKLGNDELEFFRQLLLKVIDSADLVARQRTLFLLLFEIFLEEENAAGLGRLLSENSDIAPDYLSNIGILIDPKLFHNRFKLVKEVRKQLKVSVIVTSYNHEAYIERCIKSVLAQTGMFELEILVADDCSTDGTFEKIMSLEKQFPNRLTVLKRDHNLGMLANMKDCIDQVSGQFVAFCEGDDYWLSESKIAKHLKVMRQNPKVDMCFNWSLLHLEATKSWLPHPEQSTLDGRVSFEQLLSSPLTANFSSCFYRTKALSNVPESYYKRRSAADWLFNLYIADKGEAFFQKELLSVYNIQDRGQWSGKSEEEKRTEIEVFKGEFDLLFAQPKYVEADLKCSLEGFDQGIKEAHVIACLDSPSNSIETVSTNGEISISGWCVPIVPAEVKVVVRCGNEEFVAPVSTKRVDVGNALLGDDLGEKLWPCGFDISLRIKAHSDLILNVLVGGKSFYWGSIHVRETTGQ